MGYYDEYLEHHGVLGQKWGVRRFESANGHLTAAGKARYNTDANGNYQKVKKKASTSNVETSKKRSGESEGSTEKKKGLSDKQKKMIIAGTAIAGTALAAYGGYKLYQLNNKAKEGLANDLHQKAVRNIVDGRNMEILGDSMMFGKKSGSTLNDSYNYDKGLSLAREGAYQRHLGEDQAYRAREKNFTLKEKYDYLKKGKTTDDDSQMKMHKELIEKEKIKRAGIERNYSNLRRQAELEAQKAFRAAQNTNYSTVKPPAGMNAASKMAWKASQSLAKNLTPPGAKTINSGKKAVNSTIKVSGQTKFSQASKANDDLVNELLKKNTQLLKGF